jgi:hypothetical protein
LPAAIPLVFLGAMATVVAGCFFFSASPSMASPISTGGASRASRTKAHQTSLPASPAPAQPRGSAAVARKH